MKVKIAVNDMHGHELGQCPKCMSKDTYLEHETVDGHVLREWGECLNCGHIFIEAFVLAYVEGWDKDSHDITVYSNPEIGFERAENIYNGV